MKARTKGAVCVLVIGLVFSQSPAPTNPLCYNSEAYRDTHEQECLIDQVAPARGNPGGGGPSRPGGLSGLLHGLTGGLL